MQGKKLLRTLPVLHVWTLMCVALVAWPKHIGGMARAARQYTAIFTSEALVQFSMGYYPKYVHISKLVPDACSHFLNTGRDTGYSQALRGALSPHVMKVGDVDRCMRLIQLSFLI